MLDRIRRVIEKTDLDVVNAVPRSATRSRWPKTARSGAKALPSSARRGCSQFSTCWWAILDSNQGPQSYQDCALTC